MVFFDHYYFLEIKTKEDMHKQTSDITHSFTGCLPPRSRNQLPWTKRWAQELPYFRACLILSWTVSNYACFTDLHPISTWTRAVQYFPYSTGIVLGTIFAGGSLMARNDMSPGDLMSFLVASQTVQRWIFFSAHIIEEANHTKYTCNRITLHLSL